MIIKIRDRKLKYLGDSENQPENLTKEIYKIEFIITMLKF